MSKLSRGWWIGAAVFAVVVACAAMLFAIWQFEESRKPVRTVVVENPDGEALLVVEMRKKEGPEFIVFCNEHDYQDAFEQFQRVVGVTTEPLEAPGGPMVLAYADVEVPEELAPAYRAVVEVLKRHSPGKVILLAHSDCLVYDTVAAWQDRLDEVKQRQHRDLIAARHAIQTWFPRTEVEIYYADRQEDRLRFLPLHPEASTTDRDHGRAIALPEESSARPPSHP